MPKDISSKEFFRIIRASLVNTGTVVKTLESYITQDEQEDEILYGYIFTSVIGLEGVLNLLKTFYSRYDNDLSCIQSHRDTLREMSYGEYGHFCLLAKSLRNNPYLGDASFNDDTCLYDIYKDGKGLIFDIILPIYETLNEMIILLS